MEYSKLSRRVSMELAVVENILRHPNAQNIEDNLGIFSIFRESVLELSGEHERLLFSSNLQKRIDEVKSEKEPAK